MSTQPSVAAGSAAAPLQPAPRLHHFRELLADGASIDVHKAEVTAFKYLLHLVLIKPEVETPPAGHTGWMPMGHRAVGVIALRLDYPGDRILGRSVQNLTHKQWMKACLRLGVFHRALDQLALRPPLRGLAAWTSEPHGYFQRNVWLRSHWQWLRIREENPGLSTLTISLSQAVAAAEAKALAASAVRVAADAPKASWKGRVN